MLRFCDGKGQWFVKVFDDFAERVCFVQQSPANVHRG
jgi:hypothetical protein